MILPEYDKLDTKEKELVSRIGLQPQDYLTLKKKIIMEAAKNKSINEGFIREKLPEFKNVKEKIPLLYEFWVKVRVIQG